MAARAQVREEAILLAAMALLGEVGYDRMSVDAVAERAHASKATIYRRWPGQSWWAWRSGARRARTRPTCRPAACVRTCSRAADRGASLAGQDADLILGLLSAMRHDPDLAQIVRRHVLDHKREVFATVLTRAADRGDIPDSADYALLAEISSAVLFSRLLITDEPLDDDFLAGLVDVVLLPALTHRP